MIAFVQTPEVRLAYRVWGQQDGPPAVWLHGGSGDGTTWQAVAEALPFRSYCLDQRGYGASDRAQAYGPEVTKDDVIAVLDAIGLDRVILAGHSAGGIVAWRTALARPERVAALILEEPPPPVPHRMRPARPEGEIDYDWAARQATLDVVNDPPPGWWDDLAGVRAPTLMIGGGPESFLNQETLRRMASAIPDGRFVSLGGGHRVHSADPVRFAATVRDFLS